MRWMLFAGLFMVNFLFRNEAIIRTILARKQIGKRPMSSSRTTPTPRGDESAYLCVDDYLGTMVDAQALKCAFEIRLIEHLERNPISTLEQTAQALAIDRRGLVFLLDLLKVNPRRRKHRSGRALDWAFQGSAAIPGFVGSQNRLRSARCSGRSCPIHHPHCQSGRIHASGASF